MALSAQLAQAEPHGRKHRNHLRDFARKTARWIRHHRKPPGSEGPHPGATQEAFDKAVQNAKTGCPVSKLYKTNITLTAQLL